VPPSLSTHVGRLAATNTFDCVFIADIGVVFGAGEGNEPRAAAVIPAFWRRFIAVLWLKGDAVTFASEGDCAFKRCYTAALQEPATLLQEFECVTVVRHKCHSSTTRHFLHINIDFTTDFADLDGSRRTGESEFFVQILTRLFGDDILVFSVLIFMQIFAYIVSCNLVFELFSACF